MTTPGARASSAASASTPSRRSTSCARCPSRTASASPADIGALGIEIIPEQSIPGFPHADRRVRRARGSAGWRSTGRRRSPPTCSSTPSCYPDRWLTLDEQVASVHRDIDIAVRLGAPGHPGDHQHPARGDGGRGALRRGERRPAAAGGARAVPLRAPVDPRAPRGHAPDCSRRRSGSCRTWAPSCERFPRVVSDRALARRRATRSSSTTSSRPTTTTATPTR